MIYYQREDSNLISWLYYPWEQFINSKNKSSSETSNSESSQG